MRLHLIDGTYELFRAHYSRGPSRTDPQGRDVKATVGVASSLLSLLADPDEQVTHLAVAFDHPIESFRNRVFEGYKDSTGVEEALLDQFGPVEEAVAALGVVAWPMDDYEADDALATAAARWSGDVDQVRILTPDKDLGQAVDGDRVVQVDRSRGRVLDAAGVVDKLGVPPASVPDHLALVGDTADGIPGLPGFGAKTSAALLSRYGHLEAIPTSPDDWDVEVRGKPRLAQVLRERFDDALLYRDLATLRTDVPLSEHLDDLAWHGAPRDRWHAWCDELGVGRLRDRPHRWVDERS
jgi:5'-3' exonuclease